MSLCVFKDTHCIGFLVWIRGKERMLHQCEQEQEQEQVPVAGAGAGSTDAAAAAAAPQLKAKKIEMRQSNRHPTPLKKNQFRSGVRQRVPGGNLNSTYI